METTHSVGGGAVVVEHAQVADETLTRLAVALLKQGGEGTQDRVRIRVAHGDTPVAVKCDDAVDAVENRKAVATSPKKMAEADSDTTGDETDDTTTVGDDEKADHLPGEAELPRVEVKTTPVVAGESKKAKNKKKAKASQWIKYAAYRDREEVMAAIKRGELFHGKIRINPLFLGRAFVTVDGISVDIMIEGVHNRNRAMDGDVVALELMDETKWPSLGNNSEQNVVEATPKPSDETTLGDAAHAASRKAALHALWRPSLVVSRSFLPQQQSTDNEAKTAAAQRVGARSQQLKRRPIAKVVLIVTEVHPRGFAGSLEPITRITNMESPLPPEDDFAYFNAFDPRLPRHVLVPLSDLPEEFVARPLEYSQHTMCFCRLTSWGRKELSPSGVIVKTLGKQSELEPGISTVLMQQDLMQHTLEFHHDILTDLDEKYGPAGEKWAISADEVAKRRDFRNYQIFTIDPSNARDLDDALHIRALNKEETVFEVGVHIADVSHFIEKGSLLDVEARQRATSVYLPDRVLPMLPRILCERLCSLQPRVDRLAFSVVWQMNRDGSLVDGCVPWFGKSIIRSCCKLDYETAQRMLDGSITPTKLDEWELDRRPIKGDNPNVTVSSVIQAVKRLRTIAKIRRATRFKTGSITLNNVKLTFKLDEHGNPIAFGPYQKKDSNHLVEEFMLLANFFVAQRLLQMQGPLAFIRRHPEPNQTSLLRLLSTLSDHGIEVHGSSPKQLLDLLHTVQKSRGDHDFGAIQKLITKSMKQAEYLVAGTAGGDTVWRHFALNIPYYTHFTSPIRRYADVVVHRLLHDCLAGQDVEPAPRPSPAGPTRSFADIVANRAPRVEPPGLRRHKAVVLNRPRRYADVAANRSETLMVYEGKEAVLTRRYGDVVANRPAEKCKVEAKNDAVWTGMDVSEFVQLEQALFDVAQNCNMKKKAAKNAEKDSSMVFLCAFVKMHGAVNVTGTVVNSGSQSFTVFISELGEEQRIEVKGLKNVRSSWHHDSSTLSLEFKSSEHAGEVKSEPTGAPVMVTERVDLKFLTKLQMRMTTTDRMPLTLKFEVVGPWKE